MKQQPCRRADRKKAKTVLRLPDLEFATRAKRFLTRGP